MATPTTEIYTLSLHDALPIWAGCPSASVGTVPLAIFLIAPSTTTQWAVGTVSRRLRSEEHTSELQSLRHLVCRLLLEKKKKDRKEGRIILQRVRIADVYVEHA